MRAGPYRMATARVIWRVLDLLFEADEERLVHRPRNDGKISHEFLEDIVSRALDEMEDL